MEVNTLWRIKRRCNKTQPASYSEIGILQTSDILLNVVSISQNKVTTSVISLVRATAFCNAVILPLGFCLKSMIRLAVVYHFVQGNQKYHGRYFRIHKRKHTLACILHTWWFIFWMLLVFLIIVCMLLKNWIFRFMGNHKLANSLCPPY